MNYAKRDTTQNQASNHSNIERFGSNSSLQTNGSSNGVGGYAPTSHKIPSSSRSNQNRRNDGKWSVDLDSAMNITRGPKKSKPETDMTSSKGLRSQRKKQYQERKSSSKSNGSTEGINENGWNNEEATEVNNVNTNLRSKQVADESRDVVNPRLSRRSRRKVEERCEAREEDNEDALEEEGRDYVSKLTRRLSVPISPEKTINLPRSRQRRRASEATHLHQHMISAITEESQVDAGDSLSSNIALRKNRWKLNERYRDILENPSIVTFGQWRVKKEGNYAPEEKYGVMERSRIRSSTDSDSVSPVRNSNGAIQSEAGNSDGDGGFDEGSSKVRETSRSQSNGRSRSSTLESSAFGSEHTSLDEEANDACSSNSTSIVIDSSPSNTASNAQPRRVFKLSQVNQREQDRQTAKVILNGADDDIKKFNAAASSSGNLSTKMEEMSKEYEIVRTALEELQESLSNEEAINSRMEAENERLRNRNELLNEEVNRLTRIMEINQSTHSRSIPVKQTPTRAIGSQTEERFEASNRTSLSSVKDDLLDALEQLNELHEKRKEFDDTIETTKRKLYLLLEGTSQR